jgi:flagellar protein FlbD
MIWVTRLNGSEIVVNADLIETLESTPDTVLTLVDGKKYVVQETAGDVVQRIQAYRASILRIIDGPVDSGDRAPSAGAADLYLLPGADEEA